MSCVYGTVDVWQNRVGYSFICKAEEGGVSCQLQKMNSNNLGKYIGLSETEDIFITRIGKVVAKLTNPYQDRVETAKSLSGILPADADLEEAKRERGGARGVYRRHRPVGQRQIHALAYDGRVQHVSKLALHKGRQALFAEKNGDGTVRTGEFVFPENHVSESGAVSFPAGAVYHSCA